MTTTVKAFTEQMVHAGDAQVQHYKGGMGEPLLVFHDELGFPGWVRFLQGLAKDRTVYMPMVPGFGESPRLDWVMTMRDMAGWSLHATDSLGLGPVKAIGISIGGWLAAEMAAMEPHAFKKLALVSPMGIRPPRGEILDMFVLGAQELLAKSVLDPKKTPEYDQVNPQKPTADQVEMWERGREESCLLGWKTYMHDPVLPHLLRRLNGLPTLVLWGRQDPIIPVSAGEAYRDAIKGSRLVVLEDCGHHPELEKTEEFLRHVQGFLKS